MKGRIIILGAGIMQGPAIKSAKELGLETIAVDGNNDAPCAKDADKFFHIDLKDKDGIAELGKKLQQEGRLSGIMTAGTDFSATVAYAAEKLGLPGIPYETALDASDKERMRKRFDKAGVPSPAFVIFSQAAWETQLHAKLPFDFPAVVKPVDNMGSRGCRRVDTGVEMETAIREAMTFSRSGRVIVEEYMEGPEFSVDAIVYNGDITICGLADRHIFFPPFFVEMGHTMPTNIDPKTAAVLLDTFKAGVRSLGITLGAAKGDIKLTPKGPMIGEIAARLSGGYMSGWTYPYASGASPTKAAILAAIGQKPDGTASTHSHVSAERAVISIAGTVHSIHGKDICEKIKWVKNLFLRIDAGGKVIFPENNVSKCGNVISCAATRDEAVEAAEKAARSILIRLAAPDEATEAFLAADGNDVFPPPAFGLDAAVLQAVESLPAGTVLSSGTGAGGSSGGILALCPFPAFTESAMRDYAGRSAAESLDAVRRITAQPLPLAANGTFFGREFWKAMLRGGYQGAAYIVDKAVTK